MGTGNHHHTIVIGGGQAGLVTGYQLKQRGLDFVILDASERIGDAWRKRWDSLRLFTPARMNGLPGMSFPGKGTDFVGKDDVADFLEDYAHTMELPVRSGVRVARLERNGDGFRITTDAGETMTADNVVVAMAGYQKAKVPGFASDLDPTIRQMHSTEYHNPSSLQDGPVLIVGLGNTGADLALEASANHRTIVAGSASGAIPFKLEGWFGRHFGARLVGFMAIKVLNTSTPIGRKARPRMLGKAAPLVRVRPKELSAAGVERVGRIDRIENGKPVTTDGEVLDVANVIWCTGYSPGFDWIDIGVLDDAGKPIQERGIVADVPGLYFVGLFFLHALWSETIPGMQPDVAHVVDHLAALRPATVRV